MKRRLFLLSTTLGAVAPRVWASRDPTPSQAEGPFYPVEPIPLRDDLMQHADGVAGGEPLRLTGRVVDRNGRGLAGARVEIWQCDARGIYRHPRDRLTQVDPHFAGYGAVETSASGEYGFKAMLPVPYTGRPPHIHVKILHAGEQRLTTQLYLKEQTEEGGLLSVFSAFGADRKQLSINPGSVDGVQSTAFEFVIG